MLADFWLDSFDALWLFACSCDIRCLLPVVCSCHECRVIFTGVARWEIPVLPRWASFTPCLWGLHQLFGLGRETTVAWWHWSINYYILNFWDLVTLKKLKSMVRGSPHLYKIWYGYSNVFFFSAKMNVG